MMGHVLGVARHKSLIPAFVLIDPTFSTGVMQNNPETKHGPASKDAVMDGYSLIDILRYIGFRRIGISRCFAFANDQLHPSRNMSAAEDRKWDDRIGNSGHQFNMSVEMQSEEYFRTGAKAESHLQKLATTHPLHWATMTLPVDECIQLYSNTKRDFEFVVRDPLYRNVLHVAASEQKAQCVIWLLQNVKKLQYLKTARNLAGYTPLEDLEARLETIRTSILYFDGFPINAVVCLAALLDQDQLDAIDRQRLRFGCSCGGCVEGFMSPRTQFALMCKATKIFHTLDRNIYDTDDEPWTQQYSHILQYVKPEIQENLELSQDLRQGFINLFFHIAEIIENGLIPNIESVKKNAWDKGDRQPTVPSAIFENGTTEAAIQIVFEMARDCDEWAGSAEHEVEVEVGFKEEVERLPRCRNDHEWELVVRMCGLRELGRGK
ncbi:hypothetical protein ONS95_003549 [Cadophora gregata]|uniref:uncharacterized protein n=1 Tax=Cadophora gregata TaxID=51156 RepID=UPI0026DD4ADB|nr:uncharacterized protein ONS95_003549 [Cadophora gregata]KAK0099377.1 hypothetical protein ONS96_008407 [Cadophora gregata f. sp. sojae]KAK0106828.1 hypothetical protein ONS95_003549 [Cadophora gregata]